MRFMMGGTHPHDSAPLVKNKIIAICVHKLGAGTLDRQKAIGPTFNPLASASRFINFVCVKNWLKLYWVHHHHPCLFMKWERMMWKMDEHVDGFCGRNPFNWSMLIFLILLVWEWLDAAGKGNVEYVIQKIGGTLLSGSTKIKSTNKLAIYTFYFNF